MTAPEEPFRNESLGQLAPGRVRKESESNT
jgi:hypothetical protein